MTVSIQLIDEEYALADRYAKQHSQTIEEAFTQALFAQIEEEYDRVVWEDAYRDYTKDRKQSRPISALWQEIGI